MRNKRKNYVKLSFNDIEYNSLRMCANYEDLPLATFVRFLIMEKTINEHLIKKAPTTKAGANSKHQ